RRFRPATPPATATVRRAWRRAGRGVPPGGERNGDSVWAQNLPADNLVVVTNDSPASAARAAATTASYKQWQKATRLPFGSRLFTAAVSLKAPYSRTALPHVTEMRPGRCVVRGPGWWGNRNHIGTFHVIAACNLAEFAMGMLAEATVPATHRWIPVGMNVRYPAKSTGGMTVTAEWEQIPDFESITSGRNI